MRAFLILVLSCLAIGAAGATPADEAKAVAAVARAEAWGLSHARSRAERDLIETDLAFARDGLARGPGPAFADRMAPGGAIVTDGRPPITDRADILASFRKDGVWRWAPYEARVSGRLGVTYGIAAITVPGREGQGLVTIQSHYVTIWEKGLAGDWRIQRDIGVEAPPPPFLAE